MSEQIDVKEIERKTYTAISKDGFNQMLIGLIALGLVISIIVRGDSFFAGLLFSGIYGVYCAVTSIVIRYLQKRITYPRVGYVKTQQRKKDLMLIFVLIAVLFFVVFSIVCIQLNLGSHPLRIFGFIIPLSAGALIYGHIYHDKIWARLAFLYLVCGIFLFLSPFFNDFRLKSLLTYVCIGIITFVSGTIRLHYFLKTHPVLKQETAHVNQG